MFFSLPDVRINGKPVFCRPYASGNFISLFVFQLSLRALATYHATAIPKINITIEPIAPSFACAKAEGIPAAIIKNVMIKHLSHRLYYSFYKHYIGYFVIFYISIKMEPIALAMKDAFLIIEFGVQCCSISLFNNMLSYSFL